MIAPEPTTAWYKLVCISPHSKNLPEMFLKADATLDLIGLALLPLA